MRKKEDFFARLGARLDIPSEVTPGGFSILLSGQNALMIHGRVQICAYTEMCVLLRLEKRDLRIEGKGLLCRELAADYLQITGTVTALLFEREGEHAD